MSAATLALVDRWATYYNDDVVRMVTDCYAPGCKVYPMGLGVIEGHAHLHKVEAAVLAQAPKRRMRIEHVHASGNVVCVEATLLDADRGADFALPFVAVLTVIDDRIVSDRTYADWSRWPGL
jgi:limonene-1,2-epoxide hydrolase